MIGFIDKLASSTLETLSEAQPFLLIIFFYSITILQLPMETIIGMFTMLVAFTVGLNLILDVDG